MLLDGLRYSEIQYSIFDNKNKKRGKKIVLYLYYHYIDGVVESDRGRKGVQEKKEVEINFETIQIVKHSSN